MRRVCATTPPRQTRLFAEFPYKGRGTGSKFPPRLLLPGSNRGTRMPFRMQCTAGMRGRQPTRSGVSFRRAKVFEGRGNIKWEAYSNETSERSNSLYNLLFYSQNALDAYHAPSMLRIERCVLCHEDLSLFHTLWPNSVFSSIFEI